jgi:uncharacterized protein (TIGR02391 family)
MMLNFYAYREETKRNLLRRWERLDLSEYPLDWAWIAYALSLDGTAQNPFLDQAIDQALKWVSSETAWEYERNLGALGLLCFILRRANIQECDNLSARIVARLRLRELIERGVGKFSLLNDPDIVFGVALGVTTTILSDDLKEWLQRHCLQSAQTGNLRRRLLFLAAAIELGASPSPVSLPTDSLRIDQMSPALWFAERYRSYLDKDEHCQALWDELAVTKEAIILEPLEQSNGGFVVSNIDIAMLYEALTFQTRAVDPLILFQNFPLHPEVRRLAESLFAKGEYVGAVFEAAKAFVDVVKQKAGHPAGAKGQPLDGAPLMQHVFSPKHPILKFNALASQSDKDEHRGLGLIAEGIVAAVRNPKGHAPKDKITLDAYEALEQLIVISYLFKRVDKAQK